MEIVRAALTTHLLGLPRSTAPDGESTRKSLEPLDDSDSDLDPDDLDLDLEDLDTYKLPWDEMRYYAELEFDWEDFEYGEEQEGEEVDWHNVNWRDPSSEETGNDSDGVW